MSRGLGDVYKRQIKKVPLLVLDLFDIEYDDPMVFNANNANADNANNENKGN